MINAPIILNVPLLFMKRALMITKRERLDRRHRTRRHEQEVLVQPREMSSSSRTTHVIFEFSRSHGMAVSWMQHTWAPTAIAVCSTLCWEQCFTEYLLLVWHTRGPSSLVSLMEWAAAGRNTYLTKGGTWAAACREGPGENFSLLGQIWQRASVVLSSAFLLAMCIIWAWAVQHCTAGFKWALRGMEFSAAMSGRRRASSDSNRQPKSNESRRNHNAQSDKIKLDLAGFLDHPTHWFWRATAGSASLRELRNRKHHCPAPGFPHRLVINAFSLKRVVCNAWKHSPKMGQAAAFCKPSIFTDVGFRDKILAFNWNK